MFVQESSGNNTSCCLEILSFFFPSTPPRWVGWGCVGAQWHFRGQSIRIFFETQSCKQLAISFFCLCLSHAGPRCRKWGWGRNEPPKDAASLDRPTSLRSRRRVPLFLVKFRSVPSSDRETEKNVSFRFGQKTTKIAFRFMSSIYSYSYTDIHPPIIRC